MARSVDIVDVFGDDVVHLHGNLYRVKRDRIRIARSGVSVEDGKLVYGNPRWFLNGQGEMEARGTESSKMEELKSSIQNSGMDNPLRLRPVEADGENFLEVVNGERRFRCITHLCDAEEMCHDSASGKKAKATKAYEWVDCRIDLLDDKAALAMALKTNETSEVIGDLASIYVVKALRESGHDDQEILKATGKSLSWLRETDRIMGLDEVSLEHFRSDQITRKAAIQLALIENAEERISILERIVEVARNRKAARLQSLEGSARKSEEESEIADAAAYAAKNGGDDEESERLDKKSKAAKKKAEEAKAESDKVSSKPAKADARDIKNAKGPNPLAHSKIKSEFIDLIESIIESGGFDEDGDSLGLDIGILSAVLGVLTAVMDGEDDAMSVLSCHCALETEELASNEEEDEDEDEDEEEEEEEEGLVSYDDPSDDADDETPPELESEFRSAASIDDDMS